MFTRRTSILLTGTLAALLLAGKADAQGKYPDQPVKLIVALPAGGSVDMIARTLGQKLSVALGQPFVVDNRAGGSGQIGMPLVAKAPADGYTLTVSPASFLTTNKSVFKTLPYDPETDFIPVSRLVNQPMVLIVKDRQKYPTVAALIAAAKAEPGKITYASSGDGSPQHLGGLMFEARTQTKLLHVPYRGGALAINDTIAGTVDAMFAVMPEAVPHVQSGKLHALGVMSPTRSPVFPQVPTMAEGGVVDLNLSAWIALLAPAKTPRAVIDQLNRAVQTAFDGELKAKLAESGIEVATSTPEDVQRKGHQGACRACQGGRFGAAISLLKHHKKSGLCFARRPLFFDDTMLNAKLRPSCFAQTRASRRGLVPLSLNP
jgi:tripartite-type tricarboxylate transporter receptor subunit TctC